MSPATYFSFCLQSFPASGSSPMSWLFASGGQSIGASTSAAVLQMNIRVDFLYDWLVWTSCSSRYYQVTSPASQFESINYSALNLLYVQHSHLYMSTGKTIILTIWTFVSKVMSLLFNMLSRFVIAFLSGNKHLFFFFSWQQHPIMSYILMCSYVGCMYNYNCYLFFLGWVFHHHVVSVLLCLL